MQTYRFQSFTSEGAKKLVTVAQSMNLTVATEIQERHCIYDVIIAAPVETEAEMHAIALDVLCNSTCTLFF